MLLLVSIAGAGAGAEDICSVDVVLAGCEQPANRADPASRAVLNARLMDFFVAVILCYSKKVDERSHDQQRTSRLTRCSPHRRGVIVSLVSGSLPVATARRG